MQQTVHLPQVPDLLLHLTYCLRMLCRIRRKIIRPVSANPISNQPLETLTETGVLDLPSIPAVSAILGDGRIERRKTAQVPKEQSLPSRFYVIGMVIVSCFPFGEQEQEQDRELSAIYIHVIYTPNLALGTIILV